MISSENFEPSNDAKDLGSLMPVYTGPPSYLVERLTASERPNVLAKRGTAWGMVLIVVLAGVNIVSGGLFVHEKVLNRSLERSANQQDRMNLALETEKEESLNINYVSYREYANSQINTEAGEVSVIVRNVTFASFLDWALGEKEPVHHVLDPGDSRFSLPAGTPVVFFCRPMHTQAWQQVVQASIKRKDGSVEELGMSLTKYIVKLFPGDEVSIHFQEPTPPWNSVKVPIYGEDVMVTMERPFADYEYEKWSAGAFEGKEELPNTAMFLARNGTQKMAQNLAKFFIEHRNEPGRHGRFRGNEHLRFIVPADSKRVSETMRRVSQAEVEAAIVRALEVLKFHRSPTGRSIEGEIRRATELLQKVKPA